MGIIGIVDLLALFFKVAMLLGVAWGLTRVRCWGSAAIRHGMWSLAILATLCLPFADAWMPAIRVDLPDVARFSEATAPLSPPSSRPELRMGLEPHTQFGFSEGGSRASTAVPAETVRSAIPAVDWSAVLIVIWLSGVLLRLAWLLLLYVRTASVTRRAMEVGGAWSCIAEELASALGIGRRVRLLESADVSMPLTWGAARPVIILPIGSEEWPQERLRVVLLHELAHIRRWDYPVSLLADVSCAVYWPIPLVWLARRRIRVEQEQACDDRVLNMGTTAVAYAEHLLAIARAFYGQRWELGMVVTMAREVTLKYRVRAILDDRTDRRPLRSGVGMTASAVLIALFLPVAALRGDREGEPELASENVVEPGVPGTSEKSSVPAASSPAAPVSIWIEAELGERLGDVDSRQDLEASAAGYLELDARRDRNVADPAELARVMLRFTVPAPGEYFVWGRLAAEDRGPGQSLLASIDGGPPAQWPVEGDGDWSWSRLGMPASGIHLGAGEHTLLVNAPDDDVGLDRVLLTSDRALRPTGRGLSESGAGQIYALLEAESAAIAGRVRLDDDEDGASNGEYLLLRSGRRDREDGTVTFTFDVDEAGRYLIWARHFAPDDDSNSFHASLDGAAEAIWDIPSRRPESRLIPWRWDPLSARTEEGERVDPMVYELAAGRHAFRLRAREDGVRLDAILVTNDLASRPDGLWPATLPSRPVHLGIEAESGTVVPPLAVHPDPAASASQFVTVRSEGRVHRPGEAGSISMRFEITEAGIYSIWGRTITPSSDRDSFWIRVDDGEWVLWNGIPGGESWSWSAVRDDEASDRLVQFKLLPGKHSLEVAGREGGAMLDQMMVTNDPLFSPG